MTGRIRKPSVPRVGVDELAALKERGPLLLLFTADWSAPDRKLDPIVEEIARRHAGRLNVAELDTDEPDVADLAKTCGVTSLPTLVLFSHGHAVDRLVGVGTTAKLEQWLTERLSAGHPIAAGSTDSKASVARARVASDLLPMPARRSRRVKILFLAANPSDQARLALTREVERFGDRLRATEHRDVYEIAQHWEVAAAKLQGLILRYRPQIVHFSGHGTALGELLFEDEHGAGTRLTADVLADIFAVLRKYVRCVILNACFSQIQAAAIARHVDVVIGMTNAIRDTDAIAFAGAFYEALGYGEDVKTAFELARNAIRIERLDPTSPAVARDVVVADRASSDVPELLTRPGVDPSEVRFA